LGSDLFSYLRAVLRWSWVTVILVAATVMVIQRSAADVPLVYESIVKFEVSAPEPDDVTLFSQTRTGTAREEITAVQADFSAIARGAVTARMTIDTLGLNMSVLDFQDKVMSEIPPYSTFVYIHVTDANPNDAQTIARIHAENTVKYFGESRAQTTVVRRQFITQQLDLAGKDLNAARDALLRFQTKNGTADLARDLQGYQDTLRSLRLERDHNVIEIERASSAAGFYTAQAQKAATDGDAAAATSYRNSATANQATIEGLRASVARQNELIAQRENELLSLVSLSAEYDRIRGDLTRAESNYNFLLGKLNEAEMKESDARSAGFIQMIEPAQLPARPQRVQTRSMLIPGVAASLMAGIILSFVLELIFGGSRRRRSAS
jgi:uncharacterized protein involved in exopolysaccharide biosynthesis